MRTMNLRFIVVLLTVAAAFAVRLVLDPVLHDRAPFLLFVLAVVVSSVIGGARIGLFAAAISAVAALWAFVPPRGSLLPKSAEYTLEAAVFAAVSVAVALLASRMRLARLRAEAGEAEQRKAEAEVRRLNRDLEALIAERTAELETANGQLEAFAYTVSHDLRAPLRGMEGFARILLDDFADVLGPKGRRHAERIVAAARRMEGLINSLLAFSRLQRAQVSLRAFDPTKIALAAAREAQALGSLAPDAITITIDAPLPAVMAEPVVLGQVITNLLTNAVKFHKEGEPARVRVWGERVGERVRIWVEDQGIGIAPEHQAKIFGTFERLHGQETYPGAGIGLAIVKTGVERMGGTVGVESSPRTGARFWIELAATKTAVERDEAEEVL
jgi:signal transduction histidine kinase